MGAPDARSALGASEAMGAPDARSALGAPEAMGAPDARSATGDRARRAPRRIDRSTWVAACAAVLGGLTARLLAWRALGDVPHVMDEFAYLLQARTYAGLHLTAPVAIPRAAFALWFVDDRFARYGIFPPGWPLVLAVFVKAHLVAWANPLLHAATVAVVAQIGDRVGGARARGAAAFAYAFSPQALVLAASLMSHALVAFAAAVAVLAGIDAMRGPLRGRTAALGGLALGVLIVTRPLCAAAGFVALAVMAAIAIARRNVSLRTAGAALAPAIASVALLGAYHHAVTGSATRFPQTVWFDEHTPPLDDPFFRYAPGCNALGFGPGHGCDDGIPNGTHDLANALSNTGDNLTSWIALAGGGPLAFIGFVWCIARAPRDEPDDRAERGERDAPDERDAHVGREGRRVVAAAAGAIVPATIVLYALYWYAGTCYGARFYHAALPSLVALGATGFVLATRQRPRFGVAIAAAWLGVNAAAFVGATREIADGYWGTDDRFARVAETWRGPRALVMVAFADDGVPMHVLRWTGFTSRDPKSRWRNNVRALAATGADSPRLDDAVIFAKYHPGLVRDLRARFPDRALYLYVTARDRQGDVLAPYDTTPHPDDGAGVAEPAINFDGYVIPRN